MSEPFLINGIYSDAPLFNKMTDDRLRTIIEIFSRASYHYADASSLEWGKAREEMKIAANMINEGGLKYVAINSLYHASHQLFGFDEVINAVLADLREK